MIRFNTSDEGWITRKKYELYKYMNYSIKSRFEFRFFMNTAKNSVLIVYTNQND